jgi:transglutaminase-like putative cysteine protease
VKLERIAQELVHCAPLPDWVDHQTYPAEIPDTETSCIANGACRLLNDIQVNLRSPEQAWHCRTAQRVLTREGAQRVAHVVAEFDPGYQRIEVHFVRVIRGDERIEHARPEAFQLLRRETNLERLIFDGRLTASLLIPDVRIGDVVEVCVTLYGSAPVLGGRYVAWATFDGSYPWFESRHRLVRPHARRVFMKEYRSPPEHTVVTNAEVEDSRWLIVGQQRREMEALTPPWLILNPTLQFSEFESWNDVARLLAPFYANDALPETLAAEVDRVATAHQDPAERAAEWLRFVQRELRYFAFSLGEGGLTPRALEAIWSARFGDCKDAAALYAAGARRLGLEACAALISSTHGFTLNDLIPSSGVFDHCIVRLRLNGTSHWLDPTMPVQSGTLQKIFQPHAGWALTLSADTVHLEELGGDEPFHILHREDDVTFGPKRTSPAIVRRTIDSSSWAADLIRNRIANEGTNGFAQAMLRELQSFWPGIVEKAPIEIHDDMAKNHVKVVLSYEIRDCWKPSNDESRWGFAIAAGFGQELQVLSTARREAEIYLGPPRRITSRVELKMPRSWGGRGWQHRFEASRVAYLNDFRIDGRIIADFRELKIERWTVPAKEAEAYNDVAKKVQENLLTIWAGERFGRIRPWVGIKGRLIQVLGFLGFVAVYLLVVFLLWR